MSRYHMCPECGHRLKKIDDDTYRCEYCGSEEECDDEDGISVWDAAAIWASNGKDEDYMFGYTEDELEDAL